MAFDATIMRALLGSGPATTNTYRIVFTKLPDFIPGEIADSRRDLTFLCKQAEVPSRQLETIERRYNGPVRLVPYGHIYATYNVEFIETSSMYVRKLLNFWQEAANGYDAFEPAYYDDIVGEMRLDVYNKDGQVQASYMFDEVFPISVNPSTVAWDSENTMMVIPVEFSYWRWREVTPINDDIAEPSVFDGGSI